MIYKNNSIKAVIFDMDGTLVDSSEALVKLFKRIMDEAGREISREEIMKYSGMKFDKWLNGMIPRTKRNSLRSEGKDKSYWMDLYTEEFLEYMKPINGTKEMLEDLNGNYKLALVTNTPKKTANQILGSLKIKRYFDVILGGISRNQNPVPSH